MGWRIHPFGFADKEQRKKEIYNFQHMKTMLVILIPSSCLARIQDAAVYKWYKLLGSKQVISSKPSHDIPLKSFCSLLVSYGQVITKLKPNLLTLEHICTVITDMTNRKAFIIQLLFDLSHASLFYDQHCIINTNRGDATTKKTKQRTGLQLLRNRV